MKISVSWGLLLYFQEAWVKFLTSRVVGLTLSSSHPGDMLNSEDHKTWASWYLEHTRETIWEDFGIMGVGAEPSCYLVFKRSGQNGFRYVSYHYGIRGNWNHLND